MWYTLPFIHIEREGLFRSRILGHTLLAAKQDGMAEVPRQRKAAYFMTARKQSRDKLQRKMWYSRSCSLVTHLFQLGPTSQLCATHKSVAFNKLLLLITWVFIGHPDISHNSLLYEFIIIIYENHWVYVLYMARFKNNSEHWPQTHTQYLLS